ncbi:peptidoglycan-binding protein [Anaerosinus massiliensis]|uniref:peptidoglycan-binding protein n=1 Tax=Massilibacillus massiliensis TaxID=1806837 RepID=UPI0018FEEFCB|nr:peptidoglycan-binding protein [Massilibacillus massiliensis]
MEFKWKLAVNYALSNWDGEYEFENDCTSFVSYCWRAAGIPEETVAYDPTDGWYFEDRRANHHAAAWKNVEIFHNFMVNIKEYCDVYEDGWVSFHENAKLGDVIQFLVPGKGWYHSAIITRIDEGVLGKSLYYAAHTDSHRCKSLARFWGEVRILHIKDEYRSDDGTLDDPNPESEGFFDDVGDNIIIKVQKALNSAGYDCGDPDGVQGPATTEALKAFQRENGLYPDGIIGPQTLNALGIQD